MATAYITPVPTMSTRGFVVDSSAKFDSLMVYAFETDFKQTHFYKDKIISIQQLLQESGNNVNGFIVNLREKLTAYLNKYYSNVNVDTSIVQEVENVSSTVVSVQIGISEDSIQKTFGYFLEVNGSNLIKFAKINNG